jgi:hypothetical protein
MPYSAEISRANPSCFLFIIDQSGSMRDQIEGGGAMATADPSRLPQTKARGVANAINTLLQNLVIKCAKSEGVRDYYHVGVIGYGQKVGPAFNGMLASQELVPVSDLAKYPARIEERVKMDSDGSGNAIERRVKSPIWFEPTGSGETPMCQAMFLARKILRRWLVQHPDCFPPVVVHITDGESSDGDPTELMKGLTALASSDGNVLLFNIHICDNTTTPSISFPDENVPLPDRYAKLLFETSSFLTPFMRKIARQDHRLELSETARGFVMNADLVLVVTAMDIGTRPSLLR